MSQWCRYLNVTHWFVKSANKLSCSWQCWGLYTRKIMYYCCVLCRCLQKMFLSSIQFPLYHRALILLCNKKKSYVHISTHQKCYHCTNPPFFPSPSVQEKNSTFFVCFFTPTSAVKGQRGIVSTLPGTQAGDVDTQVCESGNLRMKWRRTLKLIP